MLWDARVNVEAGTWYLGRGLGRWRGRVPEDVGVALAVAEYNAGYGNVLRWLGGVEAERRRRGLGSGMVNGAEMVNGPGMGLGNVALGTAGGAAGEINGRDGMVTGAGTVGGTGSVVGGGGGELTVGEFVGGITWPGVRDYVEEVMENWRMYRERGGV